MCSSSLFQLLNILSSIIFMFLSVQQPTLGKFKSVDSLITAAFQWVTKSKITYSHRQHTTAEACAKIVRWVAESKWPFQIVNNQGFQFLMKMGQPGYHIPSVDTVLHDVKKVFINVGKCIAGMLQVSKNILLWMIKLLTCQDPKNH